MAKNLNLRPLDDRVVVERGKGGERPCETQDDSGLGVDAVELSTAGLRKRAHELYPAPAFLEMALQAGAPVALSSDAHRPQEVGADYDRALDLLEALGVGELCVFDRRERRLGALTRPGGLATET